MISIFILSLFISSSFCAIGLNRSFNSVCGDVYTKRQFVLESQGYPSNYPSNTDCSYLIKGPLCPTYFTLQFLDFNLEDSVGCTKDRLEIENLDALCGVKSGVKTYFSQNGALKLRFRSDSSNSGRGFQIAITRSVCGSNKNHNPKEETDEIFKPNLNVFNLPNCCSNRYDAKSFLLTSPNYPKSMNQVTDCKIQIKRNNPNVCRLRIHVLFFYLGTPMNPTCGQGFLQIDNKYLCDCKSDLKLISPFRDSDVKEMRFRSNGLVSDSVTGFVLEVIQDECPKRIDETEKRITSNFNEVISSIEAKVKGIEPRTSSKNEDQENNKTVRRFSSINPKETKQILTNVSKINEINNETSPENSTDHKISWPINQDAKKSGRKLSSNFPDELINKSNNTDNKTFHNDQIHRVAWPNNEANQKPQENFANKLDVIKEKTEIFDEDQISNLQSSNNLANFNNNPLIVKNIYYFAEPDVEESQQDKEETSYIDTSSFGSVVRNADNYNQCRNWNQNQANLMFNRYGRNLPQCQVNSVQKQAPPSGNYNPNENCLELNYLRGYLRSPCYPFYYPGNLNICYRIRKQPGMCSVRVHMQDFQMEDSWDCRKDYLALTSFPNKYCGNRLHNTISTLDLRYKPYEEIRFVTDGYYCGRGFYAVYEQIACQDMSYPINPVNPLTTDRPIFPTPPFYHTTPPTSIWPDITTTTTTNRPLAPCYSVTQEQDFQFDVFGDEKLHKQCLYEIRKFSPTVCRIELFVNTFNLFCPQEALFINDKRYCGQLNNQRIVLNNVFNLASIEIVYKKDVNNLNYPLTGLRARIYGKQYTDCTYPEVPPETELEEDLSKHVKARKKIVPTTTPQQEKYLIELRDKNFKGICELVTNIYPNNVQPQNFCEIVMNNTKAIKCTPVNEFYTLYTANLTTTASAAAANNQSNRLQLSNGRLVDEVNYQEIDCEELLQAQ